MESQSDDGAHERGADSGAAPGSAPSRMIEVRDFEDGGTRIITRDERRRCQKCDGKGKIAILCGCNRNGIIFSEIKCVTCDGAGYVKAHND